VHAHIPSADEVFLKTEKLADKWLGDYWGLVINKSIGLFKQSSAPEQISQDSHSSAFVLKKE